MNTNNIPQQLHLLIPFASKWGIENDGIRDSMIYNCSIEELKEIVDSLNDENIKIINNWLGGTEAFSPPYSKEYIAFTCYIMAFEYAKARLENLDK